MSKTISGARITNKHDTLANWEARENSFTPYNGEFIVYDDLSNFKIGDGKTLLGDLPFVRKADMTLIESSEYPNRFYRILDNTVEWLNPPMLLGVQYKTIEYNCGYSIYTRIFDCGILAEGANTVELLPGMLPFYAQAWAESEGTAYITSAGNGFDFSLDKNQIIISAKPDQVGYHAYAKIWYTREEARELAIVSQPVDLTILSKQPATVSVEAVGVGLTYQWQTRYLNGTVWYNLTSGKESSYTNPSVDQSREYRCIVSDSNGNSVVSRTAYVYVEKA